MDELNKTKHKTLKKISAKFKKALSDYRLIKDNDHILIGLSGGKDSLALVELLAERMKLHVPRFKMTAAHISVENIPYQSNLDYLEKFTEKLGITFVHHVTGFEENKENKLSTCYLCSWYRRKALFDLAEQLKCNKIALGHNLDDIAETLLMNLVFQGSFGSMPPKLKMDKFDITIIRPLALITEQELTEMSVMNAYEKQIKNCPFEKESKRAEAKKLISEMEKLNPNIRQSIWSAMENVKHDYLPLKES